MYRDKSGDFPRRNYAQPAHNDYVALLIDRLRELERKTHPEHAAESANGKDFAVFEALHIAGRLVNALVGWALDHHAGLALKNLEFVPLGTTKTNTHADYLSSRSLVDDHQHEKNGGGLTALDPIVARKLLINLLFANPGGFNLALQRMTIAALEARDYDETKPMLMATHTNRKVNRAKLNLQLQAVALVKYREARGSKKYKAQEEVASAFGVGAATLRSWEQRLWAEFGQIAVAQTLSFAENAGLNENEAQKRGDNGDADAMPGLWEDQYGRAALQELAQQYRRAISDT